jgi:hypothetical protein
LTVVSLSSLQSQSPPPSTSLNNIIIQTFAQVSRLAAAAPATLIRFPALQLPNPNPPPNFVLISQPFCCHVPLPHTNTQSFDYSSLSVPCDGKLLPPCELGGKGGVTWSGARGCGGGGTRIKKLLFSATLRGDARHLGDVQVRYNFDNKTANIE